MTRLLLPLLVLAAAAPSDAAAPGPSRAKAVSGVQLFRDADYPKEAILAREQGTVAFKLEVGADGRVGACTITSSSGSAILDATTCRLLQQRARFTPARDASGKPVSDTIVNRLTWRLPSTGPTPPAAPPAPAEQSAAAAAAFKQLSTLVGTWRNAEAPDSPLRIRFFLTAGGTTLVESWERAGQPHSLTLYHRDGAALVATHHCPQGNQPRLALTATQPGLHFAFQDATDLDQGESHLHALSFDLTNPARPVRSETYRKGEGAEETKLTLVGVEPRD